MTARGIGVRELARSSGYTHGHISDLRNGRKRPSPEAAQDLDDALGAGGELAALASQAAPGRPRRHVTWDDAAGAETVSVPCRTPDGRIIFVTVPRRTFLQGMGAAAALGAVGVPLTADAGRPAGAVSARAQDAQGRRQPVRPSRRDPARGPPGRRGVYLAREATAHAGAGEAEHAAGLGAEALAIGIETRSGRIFAELADLEQALAPAASASAVARFRTAMDGAVLRPA